jgi:elongator complex protein 3
LESALRAIVNKLLSIEAPTKTDLDNAKFEVSREYDLSRILGNSEILAVLRPCELEKLIPILRRKDVRVASGVSIVAVMTEPRECPHGRCGYCPGGPKEGVPQSYTGHEPASMRGAQNDYDPFLQVSKRIQQLRKIGHDVDKIDLIIMGGTFPASPPSYQETFVKGCLDAINGEKTTSLIEAKVFAETSLLRNVGITVETRPDCVKEDDLDRLLNLGVTRVELGVQNVYDDVYNLVNRGHTVDDVINATMLLKDSGLKVCYHMMPGLPGTNPEMDIKGFKRIFKDPDFKPDMLKIYPTLVLNGTQIHRWWEKGDYKPLSNTEAINLVANIKELVPSWIRIMRVQRDIPSNLIIAGVDKSNLRQLVFDEMKRRKSKCRCIRCREVGHRENEPELETLRVKRLIYKASDGIENFISIENETDDTLVGFLRLRIPSERAIRSEIVKNSAIIRELHIYGKMVPVGLRLPNSWQHHGLGQMLMGEAERIAYEDYNIEKLLVTSALGTKEYYKKFGYEKDGVYVSKHLNDQNFNTVRECIA